MILKAQHKQLLKRRTDNYPHEFCFGCSRCFRPKGFGLAALQEKKVVASPTKIHNGTTTEFYDGADLKQGGIREGAFDFLKYPSKFGDNLVYRKVSI